MTTRYYHHHIIIGFLINMQVQGQHPHQWALPDSCTHGRSQTRSPGMSIMRVDSRELPLSAIPLQLLPCHLGPPRPTLSINLYVKGCLDCTIGAFHMSIPSMSIPSESSLLQIRRICNVRRKTMSPPGPMSYLHGLALRIWTSFRCRHWRFGFVNGQVSLAWSIALRTQELYTRPRVLKERWREERTGSRSLNFFQAVFIRVVIESSQPPAAESMSPR